VRDFIQACPLVVSPQKSVEETLVAMNETRATAALVAEEGAGLIGIFTEKDIARRVALRCDGSEPIRAVMTEPVKSVGIDEYLYYAIARMKRFGHRHMPVIDENNKPIGIIDLHDAMAAASQQLIDQIDNLTQERTPDGMREVKAVQVDLAHQLMEDNLPVDEILSLLTHINNDIYRRIMENCLFDMKEENWGEPPVPFEMIVMGSGGRGENFLYPDQDNGFILGDYADDRHNSINTFFIELAERFTSHMESVGFPLCRGYVMATNPLWRKSISQWIAQTTRWFQKRSAFSVQLGDIFFDFQGLSEKKELAQSLRTHLTAMIGRGPIILQTMFEEEANRHVALNFFGRLKKERGTHSHRDKVNLKHGGIMPLVGAVRLLALRNGIEATSTIRRINLLQERGVFNAEEADDLIETSRQISRILLRQQLRDFQAGANVSNYVSPASLFRRERKTLIGALKTVDSLQDKVRMVFTASVF
jgi:signal-transduction protein with cAMP-binding, CBS, and nucleotidyltransferase domain